MSAARRLLRWLGRTVLALVGACLLYGLAAIGGTLWQANADWREPADGITIYVSDNGVHTGIALPRHHTLVNWSDLVRPEDTPDARPGADYLLFGWGNRAFYLETPTWADVRIATVLAAMIGHGETVLHVDQLHHPRPASDMRPIRVSPAQYRIIARLIRAHFAPDAQGHARPVRGYGANDAFYASNGRYSALRTCNEWTGSILRQAGVRMGVWTPLNRSVMRAIPEPA